MSSQHLQYWFYSQDCSAGLLCTVPPLSGRHSSLPRPSEWFRSKYSEWNKVVQLWQLGAGFRCGKSQMGLFENCGIIVHKMPIVQGKTMIIQPVDLCRFQKFPSVEEPVSFWGKRSRAIPRRVVRTWCLGMAIPAITRIDKKFLMISSLWGIVCKSNFEGAFRDHVVSKTRIWK